MKRYTYRGARVVLVPTSFAEGFQDADSFARADNLYNWTWTKRLSWRLGRLLGEVWLRIRGRRPTR